MNEIDRITDLIWCTLNNTENENKSKGEQIELIKPILTKFYYENINIGRKQMHNHLTKELEKILNFNSMKTRYRNLGLKEYRDSISILK